MKLKNQLNELAKYKPTYVKTTDDVAKAADFLAKVKELREAVLAAQNTEKQELIDRLDDVDKKYREIIDKITAVEGEVRGKIIDYAKKEIQAGHTIEKNVKGKEAQLIFIADKDVEVVDIKEFVKAIADNELPDRLVKPVLSELKKYVKAIGSDDIPGCKVSDTVYFQLRTNWVHNGIKTELQVIDEHK